MIRTFARVLVVLGFVWVGWLAGHAQAQTPTQAALPKAADDPALNAGSNFELLVTTTNGETQVKCVRGCRLTWAPLSRAANGDIYIHDPGPAVGGVASGKGCIAPTWMQQNCRILGWSKP